MEWHFVFSKMFIQALGLHLAPSAICTAFFRKTKAARALFGVGRDNFNFLHQVYRDTHEAYSRLAFQEIPRLS